MDWILVLRWGSPNRQMALNSYMHDWTDIPMFVQW
jgi:hypothetical protein